jgi:hypothetical protein
MVATVSVVDHVLAISLMIAEAPVGRWDLVPRPAHGVLCRARAARWLLRGTLLDVMWIVYDRHAGSERPR